MGQLDTARLAEQYISGQAVTPTPTEIDSFNQWVTDAYSRIDRYVQFTTAEVSPEMMQDYWNRYAIVLVSMAHIEHPYWSDDINAKFRAIHDWDHIHGGFSYGMAGEACAAGYAMSTAPESIRWILWSEIALQAAAAIHTGEFQSQKLVRA